MASGVKGRVPLDSGVRARRHGITMKSPGSLGQVSSPPWASVSLSVKSGAQRRGALVREPGWTFEECVLLLPYRGDQVQAPKGKRPGVPTRAAPQPEELTSRRRAPCSF